MFHHHAHCLDIKVKVGDKVNTGTLLGHVGKTGTTYAHDHYEVSIQKPQAWVFYPSGKSRQWVKDHYVDPILYINESANLPCKWTNKTSGNQFLTYYPPHNVYHPGRDLNSGTGNQDLGNEIRSTTPGIVRYVGNDKDWGNHLWIEELTTTFMQITVVANKNNWTTLPEQISQLNDYFKLHSTGRLEIVGDIRKTELSPIPLMPFNGSKCVDVAWYRENVTPLATGQITVFLMNSEDYNNPQAWGWMSYGDPNKPVRCEISPKENVPSPEGLSNFVAQAFHEICHAIFFLTGQPDRVHELIYPSPGNPKAICDLFDYQKLQAKLITIKPQLMNQAKVVKSKNSPKVYVVYEMPSMEYLNTKANIEGFVVPSQIPNTDTL